MASTIEIRDGFYGKVKYNKDGEEVDFDNLGKEIKLETIYENIETGEITLRLSFDYRGKNKTLLCERKKLLDKNGIAELVAQGADIKPKCEHSAVTSIMMQEDSVQWYIKTYENVGWKHHGNKLVYRADSLVNDDNNASKYKGRLQITPQGTFETWRDMIYTDILGRPALEALVVASLSAVVNGIISSITTGENPIIHIYGESGTGKSSVAFVIASVYGDPFEGAKVIQGADGNPQKISSIIGSWASTENAVIGSLSGNQGMVAILNELGKFKGKDLTQIVYSLSEGTDKVRLNEKYKANVNEGFATTVVSIGEFSMLDRCTSKAKGLDIRVLEVNAVLTDNAEHSRRLKQCSRENNGWAGKILAKYILDNGGSDYVLKVYKEILAEETVINPADKSRYIEKFTALFLTTAKIAKEALGIDFSLDSIRSFCDEFWDKKVQKNGAVNRSFDEIIEHFNININNFYNDNNRDHVPKGETWGKISHPNKIENGKVLTTEYQVRPSKLRDALTDLKYQDHETQLKTWRDRGVLSCDSDCLTRKRKIIPGINPNDKERVYVLQIWEDQPQTRKGGSKLNELLAEDVDGV